MSGVIALGSRVVMHFSLLLEDGMVVDSTEGHEPIAFTLGDGTLISGLEMAISGLAAGEYGELLIAPQDGFGFAESEKVHEMPRSEFGEALEPEVGQIIGFTTPAGDEVPGTILAVGDETVRVDFNHPLAGRNFIFKFEILEVTNG